MAQIRAKSIHNFVMNPAGYYWMMSVARPITERQRSRIVPRTEAASSCTSSLGRVQLVNETVDAQKIGNGALGAFCCSQNTVDHEKRLSGDLPRNQMPGW